MRAPEWVVREIAQIHKPARLGFWKRRENSEGAFFLLELRQARRAEAEYKEFWNNRGPIFGAPFDRVTQVPVMVHEFSIEDVMYGRCIAAVRRMVTPLIPRMKMNQERLQKKYKDDVMELAGQMGSEMYWRAKKNCDGDSTVSEKDITPAEKARLNGDWQENFKGLSSYVPSR